MDFVIRKGNRDVVRAGCGCWVPVFLVLLGILILALINGPNIY